MADWNADFISAEAPPQEPAAPAVPPTPKQPANANAGWDADFKSALPDPAPLVKTMQDNLQRSPPAEGSPPRDFHDVLNDAMGMDVNKVLSATVQADAPPPPESVRKHYIDSIDNGTANSASDWLHSMLPTMGAAAAQLLIGGAMTQPGEKQSAPSVAAESYVRGVQESNKAAQAVLTGSVFTDKPPEVASKDYVTGLLSQSLSEGYKNPDWWAATVANSFGGMTGIIGQMGAGTAVGGAAGGPAGAAVGGVGGAFMGGIVQSLSSSYQTARTDGLSVEAAKDRAWGLSVTNGTVSALMAVAPGLKFFGTTPQMVMNKLTEVAKRPILEALSQIAVAQPAIGAGGQAASSIITGKPLTGEQIATGYVQNLAVGATMTGTHATRQIVGKAVGKAPEFVTPEDIKAATGNAEGMMPSEKNFKDNGLTVGMLTGKPAAETTKVIKEIYVQTGVKPDQVDADAQKNPEIVKDIAEGNVPAAYDRMRTPPPVVEAGEKLVAPAEDTLSPEHKALQDKYGVPEEMTKQMLTRRDGQLQAEMVNADKLTDKQFYALEEYQKRVEAAIAHNGAEKGVVAPATLENKSSAIGVDHSQHIPEEFREFAKRGNYEPTLEGAHKAAKDFVISKMEETGNEHLIALDKNGIATHHETDKPDSINVSEDLKKLMMDKNNGITIHHSHPTENGLGPADVSSLGHEGLARVSAHTPSGKTSSAAIAQNVKNITPKEDITGVPSIKVDVIHTIAESARRAVYERLQELVNKHILKGGVEGSDISVAHNELYNMAMDKAGLIDYHSTQEIKGVPRGVIDSIVDKTATLLKEEMEYYGFKENNNIAKGQTTIVHGGEIGEGGVRPIGEPVVGGGEGAGAETVGLKSEGQDINPEEDLGPINSQAHAEAATNFAGRMMANSRKTISDVMVGTKIGRAIVMATDPMAAGTARAQAVVKDWAAKMRWLNVNAIRTFEWLGKTFTPEQLKNMYEALDQSSIHAQTLEHNARVDDLARAEKDGMSPEEALAHVDSKEEKARRRAESRAATEAAGVGHFALPENERNVAQTMSDYSTTIFDAAIKSGLAKGEGLPFWTPRMAAMIGSDGSLGKPEPKAGGEGKFSGGLTAAPTPNLMRRKYMTTAETEAAMKAHFAEAAGGEENVRLVRDIRTMVIATQRLHQSVAGRELVNEIKKFGKDLVTDSADDSSFTLDHPALKTYAPRLFQNEDTGKYEPVRDQNGDIVMDKKPIYISKEFEGPLKSILDQKAGEVEKALMTVKGKSMSYIMYSFLTHNAVIFSKAFSAAPLDAMTGHLYFDGHAAIKGTGEYAGTKNAGEVAAGEMWGDINKGYANIKVHADPVQRAILNGNMSPIGKRFFNQELTGILEQDSVVPGRSLESRLLGNTVGLISHDAGEAVKSAIDKFGDFYHNTMLWNRVADLQMGIYMHEENRAIKSGMHPDAAAKQAGDIANLFAGSIPTEAMSHGARFLGNMAFFSRSFTMGNATIVKRMLFGMPADAKAQIERELGPEAASRSDSYARRRAMGIMLLEMTVGKIGASLAQDTIDHLKRNKTLTQIQQDYVDRWHRLLHDNTPIQLAQHPIGDISKLMSTSGHEPGFENKILWGYAPDGTGTYINNPLGKVGLDLEGWLDSPLQTLKRKEGTLVKPLIDIYNNSDYFGQKIYNDKAPDVLDKAGVLKDMVEHILASQLPTNAIKDAENLITGTGDQSMNLARLVIPMTGVTVSKGYPHGPAAGMEHEVAKEHEDSVRSALPDIRKAVISGDRDGAREIMTKLHMTEKEQSRLIKYYENPTSPESERSLQKFERNATDEERERMDEIRGEEGNK